MIKNENAEATIPDHSVTASSSSPDTSGADFVSDIIFNLDTNGRIVFISDSVKLYGYKPEELIRESILDLVCDDDKEKASKYINDQVNGIKNYGSIEIGLLTKNKKQIDFKVFCVIGNKPSDLKNKGQDILMDIHGIALDISNIKKTAEDKSYKIKFHDFRDLIRAICHELSQPVTILLGYSEMVLSNMGVNDPLYNKLNEINNQADKTDEIIRRLHRKIKYIEEDNIFGSEIIGKI